MKIGEIAKAAGVTTSRIRFYERKGILGSATRDSNGYRSYDPEMIERLKFIELAQQLGFTLREVEKIGPVDKGHYLPCKEAIKILSEKLMSIDTLIAESIHRKKQIEAKIASLQQNLSEQQEL